MPDALADSTDVRARIGRSFTDTESARVEALLADASGAVRSRLRQTITRATHVVEAWVSPVVLTERPLVSITSVTVDAADVAYALIGPRTVALGTVDAPTYASLAAPATVTYEAGYETDGSNDPRGVLDLVRGIVATMVARALGTDPLDAALTSETLDGYAYRRAEATGAGAIFLTSAEERALRDALGLPMGTGHTRTPSPNVRPTTWRVSS